MTYLEYCNNRYDYQELGAQFLLEMKHCCLFYRPGKGKTYPCIDAIRDISSQKNGEIFVLVLSTADAVKNMWNAEIVPQNILPSGTVITSFTSAIQERTKARLLKIKWDIIVIDECHKIKSHNAKISKLVHQLSKNAEYVWGLSGTPRGNTDVDIYCQFHNMYISEWGKINYTSFVNYCCDIDQKFFHGTMIKTPIGINSKYRAGWERNVAMYSQRVGYEDTDNMPDIKVNVIELPYEPTKEYKKAEDGVIAIGDYESTLSKLTAITKLHQAVNGFLYYYDEDDNRITYTIERPTKLDWLNKQDLKGALIVYRFEADLNNICNELDKMGVKYTEIVEDYKNDKADVLVLQCSRCESFNLQKCNHIIFYTLDYSYIKYNQMLHRVWRMGQTEPVQIDVLIYNHTVESNIWHAVENKEKLADLFMSIKGGI